MSSPCQPIREYNDEIAAFFQEYDKLLHAAKSLDIDRTAYENARNFRTTCAIMLKQAEIAVKKNADFRKEQRDRIELVSSHWFYGNTAYQPQLWFRGGCAGKVKRARIKLDAAELEVAQLNRALQEAQSNDNDAKIRLSQCEASLKASSVAEEKRNTMKEDLVKKNPSAELHRLLHEKDVQQNTRDALAKQARELDSLERTVDMANQRMKDASGFVSQADSALREVARLQREDSRTSQPLRDGGRAVPVVHHERRGNHPRRPGSVHCSHQVEATNDDRGVDESDLQNHFVEIVQHQRKASQCLQKAQETIKHGSALLEGTASSLIQYARSKESTIQPARLIFLGGSSFSAATIDVQELRSQITQLQAVHKEHRFMVCQLQNELKIDRSAAERTFQQNQTDIDAEKTRIFESLRALCHESPTTFPSAPASDTDMDDSERFGQSVVRNDRTNPNIVETDEPPVLVATERMSTNIPMASVVTAASVIPVAPNDDDASAQRLEPTGRSQRVIVEANMLMS